MSSRQAYGPRVQRSIDLVLEMVHNFRFDEATVFLFQLNKWHVDEWSYVVDQVPREVDPSALSMTATVIKCSQMSDLSACEYLIPGLSQYSVHSFNPEPLD